MDTTSLMTLPDDLPVPDDDGACDHLVGAEMPAIVLPATVGDPVDLRALPGPRTVLFLYPRTGQPGQALPPGWDDIPGARGCTPQNCAFRDHHGELQARGAAVYGISTQDSAYQREAAERLHLPFPLLSDADQALTGALRLPTFHVDGMTLLKRVTLVVRAQRIEHVVYPVFPPGESAEHVIAWLRDHPL